MKFLLFAAALLAPAQSIRVEPAAITGCQDGAGQATIVWDSRGRQPVTVFAAGTPMTGPEAANGAARTGVWVSDGMLFTLRDAAGETIASTRAVVRCDAAAWWPLDVGNEWHFRVNSRAITGGHAVWRVARKERIGDVEWSVLDPGPQGVTRLRLDTNGRIYLLAADGRESLLIDPSGLEPGTWTVGARRPLSMTLAGNFTDEIVWQGPVAGLGRESGRLGLGIGPTYYQTDVIAGSSGGFGSGLTLLEAVVGGARFTPDYPRLELSLESKTADLASKSARNCAIPCYFTACFGADLPATYKPCMEASVRGGPGRLTLLDPAGAPVFEAPADGWVRIPLYRDPATPLPPGQYRVTATVNGAILTLPLEIR